MAQVKNKDLAPQRHEQLLHILKIEGAVRVDTLCEALNVSPATIRRDLEELESNGQLKRVHGGAVPVDKRLDELQFAEKTDESYREKMAIAAAAFDCIQSGETVYLDGGSSTLYLARLLKDREDITVVTNSLGAAIEMGLSGPRLIFTGGMFRRTSQTVVGSMSRHLLEELHVDKAFMGSMGLTIKEGLTTTDPDEAYTKRLAIAAAQEIIVLCDSSKFGKVSFACFGPLKCAHRIITDSGVSGEFVRRIRDHGIEITQVSVENR